jgi:hypothetical protein
VEDGLSHLIQRGVDMGQINELKICHNSPGISRLLFADDSILFFEANIEQATRVKSVLNTYEKAIGQMLSSEKCSLLLGNKCTT